MSFKINCSTIMQVQLQYRTTGYAIRTELNILPSNSINCTVYCMHIRLYISTNDKTALPVNIINQSVQSAVKDYIKYIHIADSSWSDLFICLYNVLITFNSHIQCNIQVQHYCNGYNKGCSILRYITIYKVGK